MTKFPCFKCAGSGEVAAFRHVANGVCFQCGGTGKLDSRKAEAKVEHKFPVIAESERCSDRQWAYLEKLTGGSDSRFRKAVYAAGAPCANQTYISRSVMTRAIEIATGMTADRNAP